MFYYFGSKARLAKYYPSPTYQTIIEPFAGSAGYSCFHRLARRRGSHRANPKRDVILIEKDPRVVKLWGTLRDMTPEEILRIPAPIVGVESSDLLVMLRAASEHSLTGEYITVTPRMVSRWPHLLHRIAGMVPKIKHWKIILGDYSDAPDIEATWFVDPPYRGLKRGYACRDIDYEELTKWCRSRRGQVIVCEQDGASWLPFRELREIRTTNNSKKTEVVWLRD